ncbi:MAG: toxin-antitoxin system YwqK family antitoxin, partial [Leadbetterella sp.]
MINTKVTIERDFLTHLNNNKKLTFLKKQILILFAALAINTAFGQEIEKLDYCNCEDKIDQISPVLNGKFVRKCNGLVVEKGEFIDGLKNGEWITYSRKGKLIRKLNFDNGLFQGKVELFYTNGQPKVVGQFDNGNKVGKWTYFTNKNKVLAEGSYDSNKPIDT